VSGPVSSTDAPATPGRDSPAGSDVEIIEGRATEVGGFAVRRVLPRRPRRTVGPWCFVDHLGPGEVTAGHGLDVGPHPHIGLQTVTWLVEGAVLHRDSLGSEQVIRPGQLNLMTAGHGVSHSEETSGVHTGRVHGAQLWVAQPSATRHGPAAFEHHADLPRVELPHGEATTLVGSLLGATSPARHDSPQVGAELSLRSGRAALPLERSFEHALVVLEGTAAVEGRPLQPGQLAYLGLDRDGVGIDVADTARLLLLGGEPFPEPLLMWWNYVARTRDEIATAHREWTDGDERFGAVATSLARIDVPPPAPTDRA
jgi:redox-sensitive bicupin YhaK (pirin superfamily)